MAWVRKDRHWWQESETLCTVCMTGPAPERFHASRPRWPSKNPYKRRDGEPDYDLIGCYDDLETAMSAAVPGAV